MKKVFTGFLIILFLILLFCTPGCTKDNYYAYYNVQYVNSSYINMSLIETGEGYDVYYDTITGVMYLVVHGGDSGLITPILEADGTPRLHY